MPHQDLSHVALSLSLAEPDPANQTGANYIGMLYSRVQDCHVLHTCQTRGFSCLLHQFPKLRAASWVEARSIPMSCAVPGTVPYRTVPYRNW